MNCGRCHTCGTTLRIVLDGEEWCPRCGTYRRYRSHGWTISAITPEEERSCCLSAQEEPEGTPRFFGDLIAEFDGSQVID